MTVTDGIRPEGLTGRACVTCGQRPPTHERRECGRCIARRLRAIPLAGRPICEVPDCGNLAVVNQGRRCQAHFRLAVDYHVEPGPLESPCRVLDGAGQSRSDYGTITLPDGRHMGAHRAVWTMFVGPIPDGLFICHRCDRPGCLWLPHLFLGTAADNNADTRSKGRHRSGFTVGHRPVTARFTDDEVRAIKRALADGEPQRALARRMGIPHPTISGIAVGRRYRDVV